MNSELRGKENISTNMKEGIHETINRSRKLLSHGPQVQRRQSQTTRSKITLKSTTSTKKVIATGDTNMLIVTGIEGKWTMRQQN